MPPSGLFLTQKNHVMSKYKSQLLISICLIMASRGSCQELFNNRYFFGYAAAIFTGVHVSDTCIYGTGIIADTLPPRYPSGLFFSKLAHDGAVDTAVYHLPPGQEVENWLGGLTPYEGGFLTSGTVRDSSKRGALIFFDAQGRVEKTAEFGSLFPPHEYSFILPSNPAVGPGALILLPSRDRNGQGVNNTETVLQLFSPEGELLWRYNYGVFDLWDAPAAAVAADGYFVVAAARSNKNKVRKNYTYQNYIFAVDTSGQVLWSYLSPLGQLLNEPKAILAEPDGSIIVATMLGEEVVVNPSSNAIKWGTGYLYKLSPQRQVEWSVRFEEPLATFVGNHDLNKIIKASDQSGYLIAGYMRALISDNPPAASSHGWLIKISLEGDSLWSRRLRFLEQAMPYDKHELYDLEEMPDGGYLLAGQVTYYHEPVPPIQRGWLLRVDEHGCLVPGCQLVSTREAGAPPAPALHLYPNPASETLYVLLKDERIAQRQGAQLRLLDMQGRPLRAWPAGPIDEATSVLPLSGLPAGLYVLQYVGDGQVLGAERVVVR
jgi:hypothetical protein